MLTAAQQSLEQLIPLLKLEKEADYAQYERKMLHASLKERRQKGVTWYPVNLINHFISTGERYTLEFDKTNDFEQHHSFKSGGIVSVFSGQGEDADAVSGVVSFIKGDKMRVALNSSSLPAWIRENKLGVNLLFDDGSYREMNRALKQVIKAKQGRVAEIREILYGAKNPVFKEGFNFQSVQLNPVQNKALTNIFNAKDIAIIHGPPGTGKTTTLVNAIKEVVKNERQVLVCAQSNAAVDLVVEKLDILGVEVLRLGHPARLTKEVIENSLDVRITKHAFFNELKALRKRAEAFKRQGYKYKRQFRSNERMQRQLMMKEARLLREDADRIESQITQDLMDRIQVIACTLVGATHHLLRERTFRSVFIDEASQALEPACWIPILKAHRVIMAGDHLQLPPTVKSIEAGKLGLSETLFDKAIYGTNATVMLQTQYRMHPAIMKFSSEYFYNGRLQVANEILNRYDIELKERLVFIDTAGCGYSEKVNPETLSTYNEEEAKLLIKHLKNLGITNEYVGVIVPYKAQTILLNDLLLKETNLDGVREQITVNTVDSFQGQERDVIYIGLTRSNTKGEIGFLKEYRRMNVAMTRAKSKLVMIGDSSTLGNDPFYNAIIEYAQEIEGYKSAFEFLS